MKETWNCIFCNYVFTTEQPEPQLTPELKEKLGPMMFVLFPPKLSTKCPLCGKDAYRHNDVNEEKK